MAIKMPPPSLSVTETGRNVVSRLPISMEMSNTIPEQQAIITMALNGILILRRPYVKPTEKLSMLTAIAKNRSENEIIPVLFLSVHATMIKSL